MTHTRFIMVRHGETEWNKERRVTGQLDSALTILGMQQMRQLAERLKRVGFDLLYSSDLGRATFSAEMISKRCSKPMFVDPRLREQHSGIFQGLTNKTIMALHPREKEALRKIGLEYIVPKGESLKQCLARIIDCLEELALKHPGCNVVIVTHKSALKGLLQHVLEIPFASARRIKQPNGAINVFIYTNSGWFLETWGDVSHLESLEK